MKLITLYRPVGQKELDLIQASGNKKFPPRLEWQPIFYPVMNQAYAEQIALEWNTKDAFSGYACHFNHRCQSNGVAQFFILPVGK